MTSVRVVIVTPEKAVLDEPAASVTLPLFDGELGVLPGHSAFVGQLGPGELRLTDPAGAVRRFFVDGGFAQVRADVVNVLTPKAVPAVDVTTVKASEARAAAEALPNGDPTQRLARERALDRARGMERVAAKA
jgi:F-type H+-transporting ATPase subunit epsilon